VPHVRLHDLRHALATTLLVGGVHPKVVSEALGHSSTSFTMDVYSHVLPTMGEQVAAAIETALGG
jgi:integrase